MPRRKYQTAADRQFAYRLRHGKAKLVRLTLIENLYREIERRKSKLAAAGVAQRPADALLKVLELLNWVEKELSALRPVAKAQEPV